ncbi:hypothetical protein BJY00DRAFT_276555 [Aspergillus carlsbadensis]|nr:hypothetical protein BJY00DRAFT_276555 [Aspergillus carlsbadensis]
MAVCQVAGQREDGALAVGLGVGVVVDSGDCMVVVFGQMNGFNATREDRSAPNRSMLSMPVMADQPEISRALEMRNCAMLMAPYGSKAGIVESSISCERNRRTASAY